MYKSLISMLADASSVLRLEPEELAGVVIVHLNSFSPQEQWQLNRHNFLTSGPIMEYPQNMRDQLSAALAEAWAWLERECLIAPKPDAGGSHGYFVTRRGRKLVDRNAYATYRR